MGTIYVTTTMGKSGRTAVGTEMMRRVEGAVSAPDVAIRGINAGNIADVARVGADCTCVVSTVTYAADLESAG